MTNGDAPELLDRGDVAMGGKSWQTVRMDSPESCLQRIDSAFRFLGAYRVEKVSLNRVPTEQGGSELCTGVPRTLGGNTLQADLGAPARIEGTGNG